MTMQFADDSAWASRPTIRPKRSGDGGSGGSGGGVRGMLHGQFVVWRMGEDRESIVDWGIYQPDEGGKVEHPSKKADLVPDVVCDARVPVYSTGSDPDVIDQPSIDRAIEVLKDDLCRQIRETPELAPIRAQFEKLADEGRTTAAWQADALLESFSEKQLGAILPLLDPEQVAAFLALYREFLKWKAMPVQGEDGFCTFFDLTRALVTEEDIERVIKALGETKGAALRAAIEAQKGSQ
jgi:hypothetical protein